MSELCRLRRSEGYGACTDDAKTLGIAPSSAYELLHSDGFPTLKIESRLVVPKEEFIRWVKENAGGER